MKRMTMKDIADIAGVSRVTVSRYFNGGYVSEKNRKIIKEIIAEHDYIPNPYAQSLNKEQPIIGVIIPTIVSRTSNAFLKGVIEYAKKFGYRTSIYSSEHDFDQELEFIQDFTHLRVKGIILHSTDTPRCFEYVKDRKDIVMVSQIELDFNSVIYPNLQVVDAINSEIITPLLGKITKVVSLTDDKYFKFRSIPLAKKVTAEFPQLSFTEEKVQHEALGEIPFIPEEQTLYICASDQIAINLYRKLRETSLAIGEDVFVLGFGNYDISSQLVPPLTSIDYSYYESGAFSAKKIIEEDEAKLYMDFEILHRASTGR